MVRFKVRSIICTILSLVVTIRACSEPNFDCGNGNCISNDFVCDGDNDCGNYLDELHCIEDDLTVRNSPPMTECFPNEFACEDETMQCIPTTWVCDTYTDCLNSRDEANCTAVPNCLPGYELFNKTCVDVDECTNQKQTNLCSQRCVNLPGSYRCECFDDYEMRNSSCVSNGNDAAVLFFSTGPGLSLVNLKTGKVVESSVEVFNVDVDWIKTLDLDLRHGKLYFLASSSDQVALPASNYSHHNTVYYLPIDPTHASYLTPTTNPHPVFHDTLSKIEDISVDWITEQLYLTDSSQNRIIVCNTTSLLCATLISNLTLPKSLVLLPDRGQFYWTQWDAQANILKARMDGLGAEFFLANLNWINDLIHDDTMNRLYWCDFHFGTIKYFDLDIGKEFLVFEGVPNYPFSMATFEDSLYWSDWASSSLNSCNRINCLPKPLLNKANTTVSSAFDVALYHPLLAQKKLNKFIVNPCENHQCSHFCLLTGPYSYSCHCPNHSVLASDQRTCVAGGKKPRKHLILSTGKQLYRFFPGLSIGTGLEEIATPHGLNIDQLAINVENDEIYIYDSSKLRHQIGLLDLKQSESSDKWHTLVNSDLKEVSSLAYEVNSNTLYWTDSLKGTLEVIHTVSKHRSVINQALHKPLSMTIAPWSKTIYIGQVGTISPEIISLTMDGIFIRRVVSAKLGLPVALVTYRQNELIWVDYKLKKFNFVQLNSFTSNRSKLIEHYFDSVSSATILNQTLYWINSGRLWGKNLKIESMKKLKEVSLLRKFSKVIAVERQRQLYRDCERNQHLCAHLCLIGRHGASCQCSHGYSTTDNGLTCTVTSPSPPIGYLLYPSKRLYPFSPQPHHRHHKSKFEEEIVLSFGTKTPVKRRTKPTFHQQTHKRTFALLLSWCFGIIFAGILIFSAYRFGLWNLSGPNSSK